MLKAALSAQYWYGTLFGQVTESRAACHNDFTSDVKVPLAATSSSECNKGPPRTIRNCESVLPEGPGIIRSDLSY